MPKPVQLPEAEDLGTDQLTEEQRAAVQEEKDIDWDEALDSEEKPEDKPKDKDDVTLEDKEDTEDKPEDKPEDKEDDEAKEAEVEAKKVEEAETERLDKKAKDLEKTVDEVKEIEKGETAEQERIEKIAKDEDITVEEVKENEEKDLSVAERHSNDPKKLARALRKEQSEYGKLKTESDALKDYKSQHEESLSRIDKTAINAKLEEDRDKLVDMYRDKFPEDSEDASDDAIFERAKAKVIRGIEQKNEKMTAENKVQADDKRKVCLTDLAEEYKDYKPEITKIIGECSDRQILDKDFSVEDIAMYARGRKFTPEHLKTLEDAAYKRGSERAKIVPKVPGGKPSSKKGDTNLVTGASSEDRDRALQIYSRRDDLSESQKIAMYIKEDKANDF